MITILKNGCVITSVGIFENAGVVMERGAIQAIFESDSYKPNG